MWKRISQFDPVVFVAFVSQDFPRLTESSKEPPLVPNSPARLIVIGGGGHLGKSKIIPALRQLPDGFADCLEKSSSPR